jgi:hypothetical protein
VIYGHLKQLTKEKKWDRDYQLNFDNELKQIKDKSTG